MKTLPDQNEVERIKAKAIQEQKNIRYESDEDEGAAEYHAEIQSVIDACDEALAGKNSLARVLEAAEWVGFSIKAIVLVLLISACGGSGGSSGGGSSPISGSWLEQLPNPSLNIYAAIGGSTFTVQQSTCTISGNYTLDGNIIHASSVTRSPACASGNSSFDCTYSMASNNQLSLSCPAFSTNLQRQ